MSEVHLCGCYHCASARIEPVSGFPEVLTRMILCPTCGNKRCPRATHHKNECTSSNEPGQPGSRYA
jgi:hypothetical protein